jgi:hypothetical protein
MPPLGQHHQDSIMLDRPSIAWLRPALTLLGLTGLLALGACGGGSGAPNNPYAPIPVNPVLGVQPLSATVYSGIPTILTITSGQGPFQAFSSNAAVLPVAQNISGYNVVLLANKVAADEDVKITIQDALGATVPVSVTVKNAPILNTLTITPSGTDCGSAVCTGQTAIASVTASGAAGGGLANRQIRFDVVYGPFAIVTTNPAAPLAPTLTVVTDANGNAAVSVQATANAPTAPAQIRATEVTSGQIDVANFTVQNSTVAGQSPLTVVPATTTITAAYNNACSTGFRVDNYIYGGNPPYRITSTFPDKVTLVNSTVATSGGFFEYVTNGGCVDPLVFSIVDSAGKQVTSTLSNKPGTVAPPVVTPAALRITPAATTSASCTGKTFTLVITGGTTDYNVIASPAGAIVTPQVVTTAGGTTGISGLLTGSGPTTITVVDTGTPQQTVTATITCT